MPAGTEWGRRDSGNGSGNAEQADPFAVDTIPLPIERLQPVVEPAEPPALLETIVVTAQKREQAAADVPVSLSVLSSRQLEASGIQNAQQLDRSVPGLVFSSVVGYNVVFLRGIGTDAFLPSADPSVPIYIDDIPVLPMAGGLDSLDNIARVEVLKGPQGTLFGRNSLGGAIRIITEEPTADETFGDVKVEFGRFNRRNISVFGNLPLGDAFAITLSGYDNRSDSHYTSTPDSGGMFDEFARGGRGSLFWRPSERFSLRFDGFLERSSTISGLVLEGTRPSVLCPCEPDAGPNYVFSGNARSGAETNHRLVSANLDGKFDWFDTKLLLSDQYREVPFSIGDLDATSSTVLSARTDLQYAQQRTAEFRLSSPRGARYADRISWVAGMFYLKAEGGFDPLALTGGAGAITLPEEGGGLGGALTHWLIQFWNC